MNREPTQKPTVPEAAGSHLSARQRAQIAAAVRRCLPESVSISEDGLLDIFARGAWSGIAEPGDKVVHIVCERIGPWRALGALLDSVEADSLIAFLDNPDDLLREQIAEAVTRWAARLSLDEAIAHFERASRIGAVIVTPEMPQWPAGLERLGLHAPCALWARGRLHALDSLERSVSVVGARASTGYGEHVTAELVNALVDRGFTIVSGAAYGIDGMAHRCTLAADGTTIAVLAGGIDRLYPSGHDALLRRIIDTGLVLAELPCGFAPTKWRFLQRNRLIASLTQATIVIEAGWRSGSLNTAHHALDMNIPVGVVPGPVTSPSSAGCHRLLRETPATCVTSAGEIIELVLPEKMESPVVLEAIHPLALRVLDATSSQTPRQPKRIAHEAGISEEDARKALSLLALNGSVREQLNGWTRA